MPQLRICQLTDCYPPSIGGIENHVYCLASYLGQIGHSVDVVTHRPVVPAAMRQATGVDLAKHLTDVAVHRLKGFVVSMRGADPMIDPRIIGEIRDFLEANNYDIVQGHSFGSILVLAGLREARRLGIPTLITKHSMIVRPSWPVFVSRILLGVELGIAKWADGVVAVSKATAEELAASDVPVHVIPGGVDCKHWRPDSAARKRIRNLLGYREDHIVVGYLSRLVRSKGAMSLLRAAASTVRSLPEMRFLVVGEGPMRSQLERQIEREGLQNVITMLGFRPWWDTPDYFNAMDIFAFPSYTEACGLALLEAMACARPSVARINAGIREIVADGETGYLIASDEEFLQKLLELAQDRDLRDKIGANARRSVQGRYGWKVITDRIVEVYEEMIRGRFTIDEQAS
jgi:glycosyltransferase involved in cell wall biosynthesis